MGLGDKRMREQLEQGLRKLFGVVDVFIILTVLMVLFLCVRVFVCVLKLIKLYILNMCSLLNVSYTSIKPLKTIWDKRCKVLTAVSGI